MKSLSVNSRGQDKNNCDREQALEEVRVQNNSDKVRHGFRMPHAADDRGNQNVG